MSVTLQRTLGARLAKLRKDGGRNGAARANANFLNEWNQTLGLVARNEVTGAMEEVRDASHRPALAPGRIPAREVSIKDLAIAIGGHGFHSAFDPAYREVDSVAALEAGGMGIDPSRFQDVSLFRAATAGLVQARILEAYMEEPSVTAALADVQSTKRNGEVLTGLGGFSRASIDLTRLPNQPHQRLSFGDRVVRTPETIERGAACELTKEAVFFDDTTNVLANAAQIGGHLKYVQDNDILRTVLGIDNTYNYNGIGYNTFFASGGPWVNDHVNIFVDETDIQNCRRLASRMTDPETGKEIGYPDVTTVVYDPDQEGVWARVLKSTEQRFVTETNRTTIASAPEYATRQYVQVATSRIRNLLIDSGVSEAEATQRWFYGAPKKAFTWFENWPLMVKEVPATDYMMVDQGIFASFFTNYRGRCGVVEPRYWIRNRAS
jgi:hypothetical protein